MKIVFIGAGNVATNLSNAFIKAGHSIIQVISRTSSSASLLACECKCPFSDNPDDLVSDADLYFIAINDNAVATIVEKIPVVKGIVVHTAGSISIDIFKGKFEYFGVFYPCQTFSKFRSIELDQVPILIEANNKETESKLLAFSNLFSQNVQVATFQQRIALHICAVFACNFTNHLYSLAYSLTKKYDLPFEYLFPLIKETAEKIRHRSPLASQTGPAVRKDHNILQKHRELLASEPSLLKIYEILTESIMRAADKTN